MLCSIVIPAFDSAPWISAAIESAVAQTYRPLEVVVVDDGSRDATGAIADELAAATSGDVAVRVVRQENRGLAGARNRGIAAARGELLAFLDADDIWQPQRLERCIDALAAASDADWVVTDHYVFDDGDPVGLDRTWYRDVVGAPVPEHDLLQRMVERNWYTYAAVMRRRALEAVGGYDERLRRSEDYDLWLRLLLADRHGVFLPEPLGWYRLRPDSLSADKRAQWDSHVAVLERHADELVRHGVRLPALECAELARRAAARGDRDAAVRNWRRAARAPGASLRTRLAASLAATRSRLTTTAASE